jgi:tetratricopeptide (TPR) repeat protein
MFCDVLSSLCINGSGISPVVALMLQNSRLGTTTGSLEQQQQQQQLFALLLSFTKASVYLSQLPHTVIVPGQLPAPCSMKHMRAWAGCNNVLSSAVRAAGMLLRQQQQQQQQQQQGESGSSEAVPWLLLLLVRVLFAAGKLAAAVAALLAAVQLYDQEDLSVLLECLNIQHEVASQVAWATGQTTAATSSAPDQPPAAASSAPDQPPAAASSAPDQPPAATQQYSMQPPAASKPELQQPCQPAAPQPGKEAVEATSQPGTTAVAEATALKDRGNKFYQAGYYNAAVFCYAHSIDLQPTSLAYANRAMARLKLGQPAEAEKDCTAALQLDSSNIKALHRRGTARRQLGRLLEAAVDFEEALRLQPGHATVQADRDAALQQHLQQQKLMDSSAAWRSIFCDYATAAAAAAAAARHTGASGYRKCGCCRCRSSSE